MMNKLKQGLAMMLTACVLGMDAWGLEKLERVEPSFWWTGMRNPSLQLLVYGENISETKPSLQYEGVRIEKVVEVENPNYLFVYLDITANTKPGSFSIHFRKGKKDYATFNYELRARRPGSAERTGFTPADVMYLITPDRFVNGDPGNDNMEGYKEKANRANKGGRHGGDIEGIIDNLDYIHDLGFTAIWLNPVLENDMPSYSYHGYATTDFYKVDQRFGTNEAYRNLSLKAGEKGIKMVMDMILNHCGSAHWWMSDLPASDWLNYQTGFRQTTHRRTTVQDPYRSEVDYKEFADGWFVATMPDLNQKNDLLATYLIQNSIWWVEYAELSGIRMDTYPYPDMQYMTAWTCRVMEEYPNLNIVGEEWSLNPAITSHWQRGKVNANGYTSCLPGVMDFPIQAMLVKGLTDHESDHSGMITVYEMLGNDFLYADPFNLVIFPDNHDMDRFYTQVKEDYNLFKQGITYILTMRGIPQLYYGTEILMTNSGPGDHGLIRTDFPGGWDGDGKDAFTGAGLTAREKEAKSFIKNVLNWRKTAKAVHHGKLMHFAPENGFYVYFRYTDSHKVMVILNKNDGDVTLDLTRFRQILDAGKKGKDIISGKTIVLNREIQVPAHTPMIIDMQ
ncbi:MAG: glycoside hydrolase family 13 protein [Cytophagales bacterium]|nr:glycoside hydrolase family 13 protein [Cytophagales bacterium]